MRVVLLNQFFHPDVAATAQLATDLAEDLARAGMDVTAVAGQGTYLGGKRWTGQEAYRGVRIVRVPCSSFGKASLVRRMADYGSFFASAAVRIAAERRTDAVVAMSTPPLVAGLGAAVRALGRSRFVYWVQDLYPDIAVEFGMLGRRSLATRFLDLASRLILGRADAVVALGEAMVDRISRKGIPPERIRVIPNWADGSAIRPVQRDENPFRKAHDLVGKHVVLHSGNIGRGHDMSTLLAVAEALRAEPDLVFLFIGEGARKALVEDASRRNPAIRLLPYQPREELSRSLSAGDVHVIAQDANLEGLIEPSKLYGAMAVGRPILYIGPRGSEVARTILRENIGEVIANGDVGSAVAAFRRLLGGDDAMGNRARIGLERKYDRRHRTAEFVKLLANL
jgi:colanic acid biosynthesis glycosyl transferase WcaI